MRPRCTPPAQPHPTVGVGEARAPGGLLCERGFVWRALDLLMQRRRPSGDWWPRALGAVHPRRPSLGELTRARHLQAGRGSGIPLKANTTTTNTGSSVASGTEPENCFINHIFRKRDLK